MSTSGEVCRYHAKCVLRTQERKVYRQGSDTQTAFIIIMIHILFWKRVLGLCIEGQQPDCLNSLVVTPLQRWTFAEKKQIFL